MTRKPPITENYEIGYCKPPEKNRYRKGASGNPDGGRKKPTTLAEALRKELSKTITVVEGRKRKVITKMEAAITRLMDKAITGDMSASRLLLVFAQVMNDAPNFSSAQLEELDNKVLAALFKSTGSNSAS